MRMKIDEADIAMMLSYFLLGTNLQGLIGITHIENCFIIRKGLSIFGFQDDKSLLAVQIEFLDILEDSLD